MNVSTFSVLSTGETIERTIDSVGNFRDKVIATRPAIQASTLSPCDARTQAKRREAIILAHMNFRAKQAKPVRYGRKALQAIDYLLGDKYRDTRTMQEKREDASVKTMSGAEFSAYLDTSKEKLVNAILGDRETVEAIRKWIYEDSLAYTNGIGDVV